MIPVSSPLAGPPPLAAGPLPSPFAGTPCPHCGGTTTIEKHRALRWICGACGGPIVPVDATGLPWLARSNAELASLVRAKRTRAIAFGWTAGMIMLVVSALLALGLGGLLLLVAWLPSAILGGLGVVLFALGMAMRSRARASDAIAQTELDAAWESVADEVLRARGGDVTAKDLAQAMRTTEAHAETMLSALSLHDRARVAVDDDAELRYSAGPANAAPLVRIADDAAATEQTETRDDRARAMERERR